MSTFITADVCFVSRVSAFAACEVKFRKAEDIADGRRSVLVCVISGMGIVEEGGSVPDSERVEECVDDDVERRETEEFLSVGGAGLKDEGERD